MLTNVKPLIFKTYKFEETGFHIFCLFFNTNVVMSSAIC